MLAYISVNGILTGNRAALFSRPSSYYYLGCSPPSPAYRPVPCQLLKEVSFGASGTLRYNTATDYYDGGGCRD